MRWSNADEARSTASGRRQPVLYRIRRHAKSLQREMRLTEGVAPTRDEHPCRKSSVISMNGWKGGGSCGHLCAGRGGLPEVVRAEEGVGEGDEIAHDGDEGHSLGCLPRSRRPL